MLLADFRSYLDAQSRVDQAYRDQEVWTEKAVINIARTGRFSSDRTIAEYAEEIWHVKASEVHAP
jgi:starch phosphorylase